MYPAPSKIPFRFPVPPDALAAFCHPSPHHIFHLPRRIADTVCAANGHVAIRCTRGHWSPEDYMGATDAYILRIQKLPWNSAPINSEFWSPLDDARGTIYRHAPRAIFGSDNKLCHSPSVRVGKLVVMPLSIIQLIARLPRCEVYINSFTITDPLFFRFSGGAGIVAPHNLTIPQFKILSPILHDDGQPIRKTKFPKENPPRQHQPDIMLDDWPPQSQE